MEDENYQAFKKSYHKDKHIEGHHTSDIARVHTLFVKTDIVQHTIVGDVQVLIFVKKGKQEPEAMEEKEAFKCESLKGFSESVEEIANTMNKVIGDKKNNFDTIQNSNRQIIRYPVELGSFKISYKLQIQ